MSRRPLVEQCRIETDHALVEGTGFCVCTHAMYDFDPILDMPKEHCGDPRGGGGRTCFLDAGHKGPHQFECGR